MKRTDFDQSLIKDAAPPESAPLPIAALWWLCNQNWHKAHDLIDTAPGTDVAWIHALLHRMEGDQGNANYWYARAGRQAEGLTIGRELESILGYFLEGG